MSTSSSRVSGFLTITAAITSGIRRHGAEPENDISGLGPTRHRRRNQLRERTADWKAGPYATWSCIEATSSPHGILS
jgi:hypothetical protein